jgi:hypothetical protein
MSIIRQGFESADLDVPVVLPTLNLDFANSQSLDKRITFSRGSIGTRVNRNGLIETIPANQPRFDFDPISGECRGLLIEESRVNYFWGTQTGTGGSVSDGTATGADGVTAKKFVPTLGSAVFPSISNYTAYTFTAVSGGTVDVSFSGYFVATGTGLYIPDIVIEFNTGGTTNNIYAELGLDLTNGTVWVKGGIGANGVTELIAPQITLMPFGMYKVTWSIRYTQGATIRNRVHFYIQCRRKGSTVGSNTGTYYADGVNGFQFSCIQYEIGALPTSYIPTTASTVTRSVDNAEMTGTNFSSWYNSSEGTLFVSSRVNALGGSVFPGIAYVDDGTVNNCMGFYVNDAGDDRIGAEAYISGRAQYALFSSSATTANKLNKAISSYSINNFAGAFDTSSQIQRDTSGSIPTVNRLRIGALRGGLFPLNGTISRLTYYPKALSPAELQYLTQ